MPEVKGSHRGFVYIAIYRRDGPGLAWSASIEDDEGAVTFIIGYFFCHEETQICELLLRQKIHERMDAYVDGNNSPTLH